MARFKVANLLFLFLIYGAWAPSPAQGQEVSQYASLFTEEILSVTRERDGLLKGTLRTVLIQASGIRSQNPFTLVRIHFEPSVRRVQISKGPLPQIDGSLTTLDCSHPEGKVILEYLSEKEDGGQDPTEDPHVLSINSNGNLIRNCHITGSPGPGIKIFGNRNIIEHSIIGYHEQVPETTVPPSALYGPPATNQKAGILLGKGSNENIIQHNDIVGNAYHGVLLEGGVGTANRVVYNYFAKNSGLPIKAGPGTHSTLKPTLQKITQQGDEFIIEGSGAPRSGVHIYMKGKEKGEVGMLVAEVKRTQRRPLAHFEITTKSKGFILGETELVAISHGLNLNSSEFSDGLIVTGPQGPNSPSLNEEAHHEDGEPALEEEGSRENPESPAPTQNTSASSALRATDGEPQDPEDEPESPGHGSETGRQLGGGESETVVDLNGKGDGGSSPESGSAKQKGVTSLGI